MLDERITQTSWVMNAFHRAQQASLPLLRSIVRTGGVAAVVLVRHGVTDDRMEGDPSFLGRDADRDQRILHAAIEESHGIIVDTGSLLIAHLQTDPESIRFLLQFGVSLDDQFIAEINLLREQEATPPKLGDPVLDITARSEAQEVQRERMNFSKLAALITEDFEGADALRRGILELDISVEGVVYEAPPRQKEEEEG
ncbi:MAG: hypothetical protein Q7S16_01250 [bacterium]|nr:hypothetical protein [bacterium]